MSDSKERIDWDQIKWKKDKEVYIDDDPTSLTDNSNNIRH